MKYKIVFATSSDRHSAKHLQVTCSSNDLPARIATLQINGRIIISVSQAV